MFFRIYSNANETKKYGAEGKSGPVVPSSQLNSEGKKKIGAQFKRDMSRTAHSKHDTIVVHGRKGKGRTLTQIVQKEKFSDEEMKEYGIVKSTAEGSVRAFSTLDGMLAFIKAYLLYDVVGEAAKNSLALTFANHFHQAGVKCVTNETYSAASKLQDASFPYGYTPPYTLIECTPTTVGIKFIVYNAQRNMKSMDGGENIPFPDKSNYYMREKTIGMLYFEESSSTSKVTFDSSFSAFYHESYDTYVNAGRESEKTNNDQCVKASSQMEDLLLEGDPYFLPPQTAFDEVFDRRNNLGSSRPWYHWAFFLPKEYPTESGWRNGLAVFGAVLMSPISLFVKWPVKLLLEWPSHALEKALCKPDNNVIAHGLGHVFGMFSSFMRYTFSFNPVQSAKEAADPDARPSRLFNNKKAGRIIGGLIGFVASLGGIGAMAFLAPAAVVGVAGAIGGSGAASLVTGALNTATGAIGLTGVGAEVGTVSAAMGFTQAGVALTTLYAAAAATLTGASTLLVKEGGADAQLVPRGEAAGKEKKPEVQVRRPSGSSTSGALREFKPEPVQVPAGTPAGDPRGTARPGDVPPGTEETARPGDVPPGTEETPRPGDAPPGTETLRPGGAPGSRPGPKAWWFGGKLI